MVVKVYSPTVCHRHGCACKATLAYRGDKFAMYCSPECRRADIRANRGTPWEAAWNAARNSLGRFGHYDNVRPLAVA
jgi:hypothetical protein